MLQHTALNIAKFVTRWAWDGWRRLRNGGLGLEGNAYWKCAYKALNFITFDFILLISYLRLSRWQPTASRPA